MRINKDIGTTIFAVCSTVVGFGIVVSTVKDVIDYNNSCIKNISTKIKEKDPERYLNILNNINDGKLQNSKPNWQKELYIMNDSLKIDSLCKKAYFDGARMVKDSIKAAAASLK